MKNWQKHKSESSLELLVKVPAPMKVTNKKEMEPAQNFTGITQENYIHYRYLETVVVNSVANMSFVGLWM